MKLCSLKKGEIINPIHCVQVCKLLGMSYIMSCAINIKSFVKPGLHLQKRTLSLKEHTQKLSI